MGDDGDHVAAAVDACIHAFSQVVMLSSGLKICNFFVKYKTYPYVHSKTNSLFLWIKHLFCLLYSVN